MGTTIFLIKGEVENRHGLVNLAVLVEQTEAITRKEIKVNSLKIERLSDFFGNLTAVLFAPENLNIVQGTPALRRKLLDDDLSQVSPGYYLLLQKHRQLLKQRNHLLKKIKVAGKGYSQIEVWDEQLKTTAAQIINKRLAVLEKLNPLTRLMQRKLTGGRENLELKYLFNRTQEIKKGVDLVSLIESTAQEVKEREYRRGITLWGPQRDDFLLTLNGQNLKIYGSQGQQRTAVLAIKLAELEFFKSESGEYPLLLLDDVLSELDTQRRLYLLNIIQEKPIQCFLTTTVQGSSLFRNTSTLGSFYVQNGVLKEKMIE
jgi:DNA replication and repair protein RecF